jgi:hypothetical protein
LASDWTVTSTFVPPPLRLMAMAVFAAKPVPRREYGVPVWAFAGATRRHLSAASMGVGRARPSQSSVATAAATHRREDAAVHPGRVATFASAVSAP